MDFLLDTNVLSELRKGSRANRNVRRWAESTARQRHYISVISLGEIRRGIERLKPKDPEQARVLEFWLVTLKHDFSTHILPLTDDVADCWGLLTAGMPLAVTDSLIAATAATYGLTVATRNVADFTPSGVAVLNPFEYLSD
jgi:predicted nucleic acid-binding protein